MTRRHDLNERWGVIGHTWVVTALERAFAANQLAHAILLTGPHGIGKTTLAQALARRLECIEPNPPGGKCIACQKIAKNLSPDVRVIEGVPTGWKLEKDGPPPPRKNDRERRTLIIKQIRDLQHWLSQSPFESKFKIAIVRRFEEANEEAANAFLKTLEEPPRKVVLILTAQDASLLLPTIASRCQKIVLRPLPLETVEQALIEKWKVPPRDARLLARLSGGRIGWAVRASADAELLQARNEALDALGGIIREARAERLTRAGELAKDSEELPQLLELWLTWWRDVLLLRNGDGARLTNVDRADVLRNQAAQFSTEEINAALKSTRAAVRQLEQNANARLVMEVLALKLPRAN